MTDSGLTKLTWSKKYESNLIEGTQFTVEVNNSAFRSPSIGKTDAPYGRKPYLISKEYVPVGEPYDYLAMMETKFDIGENNDWVVQRTPYKNKDYRLMMGTSEVDATGETVEYYSTRIYTSDLEHLVVTSVRNLGSKTVATIIPMPGVRGRYDISAEDSRGNKISFLVRTYAATPILRDYYYNVVYALDELVEGKEKPYTIYTIAPDEFATPYYMHTVGSTILSSWSNASGSGYIAYHTVEFLDPASTVFVSTAYTLSMELTSDLKTEQWESGLYFDPAYLGVFQQWKHITIDHDGVASTYLTSTLNGFQTNCYKYSDASFYFSNDYHLSQIYFEDGVSYTDVRTYSGIQQWLQYKDASFYVYTINDVSMVFFQHSGVFSNLPFAFTTTFNGGFIEFAYL